MQLENLNNDKLRYVARMPRIPTPYARYINLHARVRINSSRYTSYQQKVAEEYVSYLATTSTPKALKTQEIETANQCHATLQAIA